MDTDDLVITFTYGNDPRRHPRLWRTFVELAPKMGLVITKNTASWLMPWNFFLEGVRQPQSEYGQ